MAKRISQSQIAKELGVSQSLVSLVLNGRREGISEESYNRIWSTAVANGYVPRGMQSMFAPDVQHSYVGVVLRAGLELAAQSNTFSHVRQGLFSVLQKSNISMAFLGGEGDLDEKKLFELLGRRDPLLGIIVLGQVAEPFMRALGGLNLKLVSVYASAPGLCHSVVPNEKEAAQSLVDHLVKLGHKRFAWLGGNRRMERNHLRFSSLQSSLAGYGLMLDERYVINQEEGDRQAGFDCAEELLKRSEGGPLPTAWVCHSGLMARGSLQSAFLRGVKVPEQVSVAAIDRTRACTEIHPFLTSAASDPQAIGEAAARFLCNPDAPADSNITMDMVVPSEFSIGETSGPAPE